MTKINLKRGAVVICPPPEVTPTETKNQRREFV
jgi:hypothetical protein